MSDRELVRYRRERRVGEIVLANPAKRNALSPDMLTQIGEGLDAFLSDGEAHVAIVRGEGPSFCAGVDIANAGYGDLDSAADQARVQGMADLWLRFWDSPKPIIAQIHGHCLAGALQLPLCCDIVTVADDAIIGSPKLPVGGGWIGPMLAHRIGLQHAKLFAFQLGFEMSGREAYDRGFAAIVTAADQLSVETERLARRIAELPIELLRIEKLSINSVAEAAGFRSSTYAGTVWDAVAHKSSAATEVRARVREIGFKQVMAEYDQRRGADD
jgi:enoyl-CoA hydratase/carnithine racemase